MYNDFRPESRVWTKGYRGPDNRCLHAACRFKATHRSGIGLRFCKLHYKNAVAILGERHYTWRKIGRLESVTNV